MILLRQMIVLFLIMLIGYYLAAKDILDTATNNKISWIVVNVANPALILSSGLDDSDIPPEKLAEIIAIAVGMYVILILLGLLLPRLLRVPQKERGSYNLMTIFGNVGFMGFPILSSMYGKDALLYGSMFVVLYDILIYTYGIQIMRSNQEESTRVESAKDESAGYQNAKYTGAKKRQILGTLRSILNPGVLACIAAVLLYAFPVSLPYCLTNSIEMLSSLTAPLSMMVIGASMKGISFRKLLQDTKLLVFVGIRMIVIPLIGIAVITLFVTDSVMLGVCLVMLAVPAGSMVAMLAQQYQEDAGTASKGVVLTTVLSVVTMPLVFWLAGL